MICVECVNVNSETFDGYILLDRLRFVIRFCPVKEFYLPLFISGMCTKLLQGEAKRERLVLNGNLILISNVDVLYCYLNIINNL